MVADPEIQQDSHHMNVAVAVFANQKARKALEPAQMALEELAAMQIGL